LRPFIDKLLAEDKPKKAWERKRGDYKWYGDVGRIEYEFGGTGEAEWRKQQLWASLSGLSYQPTCLDEIFSGGAVRMRSEDVPLEAQSSCQLAPFLARTQHKPGLEELFGMERHRFGKGLPRIKENRGKWYDYHAVVKIMHRLLSEKPREGRRPSRGKTRRLWPFNPNLRVRILIGIHKRMESVSVSDDIWGSFTAVACLHLARGIEEKLSEDVRHVLAALVRRHLG